MKRLLALGLVAAACVFSYLGAQDAQRLRVPASQLDQRLIYAMLSPGFERPQRDLLELARRGRSAGYNGVVLNDFKLGTLDRIAPAYQDRLRRFRDQFQRLDMALIPIVGSYGWSENILFNDPNLIEAMPVRNQELVVQAGVAVPVEGRVNLLKNPGFEQVDDGDFLGWQLQDPPAEASAEVAHRGDHALRLRDMDRLGPGYHNGRVMQRVRVRPWTLYRASMWVKAADFQAAPALRLFGYSDGRALSSDSLLVQRNQDWTQYHVTFNSRYHDEIQLYLGVWGGGRGSAWIDDVELEEVAFVNLVRREGAPLAVRRADGMTLQEGRDFEPLADPKMGRAGAPGRYDRYHEPPLLTLTEQTGLVDGDRLFVDYHHAVTAHIGQPAACLDHPKVFKLFRRQVEQVHALLQPDGYLLGHDEIRVANWCGSCRREGRGAGELLADNVRKSIEIIRSIDPDARVYAWSDMFDPHHNARESQYLVNGGFDGSWEGLPSDVAILNWNIFGDSPRLDSFDFFARRGHRQILAGYYDHDPKIDHRLTLRPGAAQTVSGVMYSTFKGRYKDLETFANQAWGP